MNRLLEETLRHYVNEHQSNWVSLLPMAEFAINNAHSSAIQSTPFFLNYGQHPRVPGAPEPVPPSAEATPAQTFLTRMHAAVHSAKQALQKAHDRIKQRFTGPPVHYDVDQQVLLSTKNLTPPAGLSVKLLPRWDGPFKVLRCIDKGAHTVAVELELPAAWKVHPVFSTSLIKPFTARASTANDARPAVSRFTI
jgi:hypothetical protein